MSTAANLPSAATPGPKSNGNPPLNLFVLIDALGWQVLKDQPFLSSELPYRTPLKTVLGYSSGAIPTILTGLAPAQSGRWNLLYYDPINSPFSWLRWASFLPQRLLDNRYSRKLIKELGRRALGMGPLFECVVSPQLLPWFNWVEKENIYKAGGIAEAKSIFDVLQERQLQYRVYSYHNYSDAQIIARASRDMRESGASFYFLYLSEIDRFLHANRQDHSAISKTLAWYNARLRELFVVAEEIDPRAHFVVMSDHGMTAVHSRYDLVGKIEKLGLKMPKDYLSVYDSTMARFWIYNDAARRAIVGELERTPCGRILDDAELEQLGVFFSDRRYGELVFLLDPGWLFARSDFNGGGWQPSGMHGYHPADPDSDAIFLSNWRPNHRIETIADLFSCLQQALERQ